MRRLNNQVLQLMAAGGPFVGNWRAQSRVTVEPAFYLNQSSGPVGNRPLAKCPIRWWQRADNSQVEIEIPNVRLVQTTYDLSQSAATVEIDILNTNIPANGLPQDLATSLGQPGFFSWTHASTAAAQARWNQTPNAWASVLRENALIRVYQGYGGFHSDGSPMSIPEAVSGGYLLLKGVFLLDNPAIDSGGITKLTGRNMAKLLIDQQTVPPVIPKAKYPLSYWGPGQATKTLTWQAVPGYGTGAWAAQRGVYDADSHNNPVGVQLAIDGNPTTAWVSENAGSAGGQVWLQLGCNELVSGVYVNPMWGNYTCYVSIFADGAWQGSGSVGGVPVVTAFFVGFEKAEWHKLPRTYMASKVRLTFTNLFHWGAGYYAAAHEISLGSTGVVTTREKIVLDIDPTPSGKGYRLFGSDGGVFDYGDAIYHGSLSGRALNAGIIGGATTTTNKGYWLAGADGGVFSFGDATFHGSLANTTLAAPIVAFRRTPSGGGYYMLGADGGVFTFGDATFHGSGTVTGGINFVDMVPRPQNDGYWLLGEDGGVFSFGGATYHGRGPVGGGGSGLYVGMDGTPSGLGYWLTANDGAVFSLGDAVYHGGANVPSPQDPSGLLAAPISGIRRTSTGNGYRLVGQDGGVFDYGDAVFYGSLPGTFADTFALTADYQDYADIIKDLALWAGFWLHPTGGVVPTGRAPDVYGVVETTGAWDTLGPLGIDFFDKRPVIDVMTDIANLVGYLIRVDDQGGFRFEAPNIWAIGNFYDDGTATTLIPTIDERTNLSDYVMTASDQDLRSPIVVAVADPYLQGGPVVGTNVTTFIPPYTPLLRGITKTGMFAVPLQVAAKDQQYFAELIALRIWFQTRIGSVTAWCNPTIEVDDQVRIYERTTAETNVHYVTAITTSHDVVGGKFEMQLTTNWLGGHDVGWAVTSNLNTFFGAGAAKPVTVMTPGNPNNSFLLSEQLTQLLANSGALATRPLNG